MKANSLYKAYDVRAKLIFTILSIIVSFFIPTLGVLYASILVVLFFSFTQSGFRKSLRSLKIITPMIIVMLIFTVLNERRGEALLAIGTFTLVTMESIENFLFIAGRFVLISLLCSLMMQTTSEDEIILAFQWFRLPPSASLTITLALRFIPELASTFGQIRESQRLRLPNPDEEETKKKPFKAIMPSLTSTLVSALRSIPLSASAIDLRGWLRENKRSHYRCLETSLLCLFTHFVLGIMIPIIFLVLVR